MFKVDDNVRISHLKTVFTRAYDHTYSGAVFKVIPIKLGKRNKKQCLPVSV